MKTYCLHSPKKELASLTHMLRDSISKPNESSYLLSELERFLKEECEADMDDFPDEYVKLVLRLILGNTEKK